MRLLGIALLAFVLAGASILIATSDLGPRAHAAVMGLAHQPDLEFERSTQRDNQGYAATLRMANAGEPVLLSGVPAWHSLRFLLPVDARALSGTAQIQMTSQVLNGVAATLRVSIDGSRRSDILLRSGHNHISFGIELSQSDLQGRQVVLALSVLGNGPESICTHEDSRSVVLEIEQSSSLELRLNSPLVTLRDQQAANGGTLALEWADATDRAAQLLRASQLIQRGHDVLFSGSGLSHQDRLPRYLLAPKTIAPKKKWPQTIDLGRSKGIRRFSHSTEWRIPVGGSAGEFIARAAHLNFGLGVRQGPAAWVIDVTLDGHLLLSEKLPNSETSHEIRVKWPIARIKPTSEIVVRLSTFAAREGRCADVPESLAELRPNSHLLASAQEFPDPLAEFHTLISDVDTLGIAVPAQLTPVDALAFATLLSEVLPQETKSGASPKAETQIHFRPAGTGMIDLADNHIAWAIWRDPDAAQIKVETEFDTMTEFPNPTLIVTAPRRKFGDRI